MTKTRLTNSAGGLNIRMGEIVEIEYVWRHLKYPSPETRHFFEVLLKGDSSPEFIDWVSDQNTNVTVPMNITVWCLPRHEDDWQKYLATRDTPKYTAGFVQADLNAE
ncbi:hypothetical protein OAH18_01705 [bacterium]|nr:hypothetical protein [bacterium]